MTSNSTSMIIGAHAFGAADAGTVTAATSVYWTGWTIFREGGERWRFTDPRGCVGSGVFSSSLLVLAAVNSKTGGGVP